MKSKIKIKKQARRKTNPELVETILLAKKNPKWINVASLLSRPTKKRIDLNLEELNKLVKEKETLVIPGKVLSQGEFDKNSKIVALSFSENAKEKLSKSKIKFLTILEEIKQNPEAKGIRILE